MGIKSVNDNRIIGALKNKKGAEMVEGAISLPLILLCALLLLRMFTFCLEVLITGVEEHIEALEHSDSYDGVGMKVYKKTRDVELIHGGVLIYDVKKEIVVKAYMINEEFMVRAGDVFK